MKKYTLFKLLTITFVITLTTSVNAEGFIKKEVYSFKDKNGNIVFTDKKPALEQTFKTQTIEAANSTKSNQNEFSYQEQNRQIVYINQEPSQEQLVRVIVEDGSVSDKKSYQKKRRLKRCQSFKKRFDYYSEKMNAGYKNSEYKKLEKNRKKYRDLLFKNCSTRTFSD